MLALVGAAVAAVDAVQQQTPFRVTRDTVPVFVTVVDKDNRLATDLPREAFQVSDNGKAQPITLFDNSPQPVRLIVMLDVSGSMLRNLPLLRASAEQLFARLGPNDQARVGSFGAEITISPEFTRDAAALRAALPTEIDPGAPTPLWRAMETAMAELAGIDERRVVLVLSDGKDTGPRAFNERFVNQLDVVERAQRDEIMIYGIGLQSRGQPRQMRPGTDLGAMLAADFPDPGLGTAAIDSGGGYFEIRPRDDLGAAFARVIDELHSQYLIGFTPPARDGKAHKIQVKVTGKDLKPRARKSYLAPKQ
ncbi:MAG TPA: VWA domain-containing protein [Vicinamibacterales bacterium]|nr:VWA domain-containing protein [Vicinamibacterales bacterium]